MTARHLGSSSIRVVGTRGSVRLSSFAGRGSFLFIHHFFHVVLLNA